MNRERAKELLPIIQAFAEGKVIQTKYDNNTDEWFDTPCPDWEQDDESDDEFLYRIKPEPIEFWTVGHKGYMSSGKDSKEDAERFLAELRAENPADLYTDWRVFKVREVIE